MSSVWASVLLLVYAMTMTLRIEPYHLGAKRGYFARTPSGLIVAEFPITRGLPAPQARLYAERFVRAELNERIVQVLDPAVVNAAKGLLAALDTSKGGQPDGR